MVTVPVTDDAPPGTANQVERRDPLAVLSRSDEDERPAQPRLRPTPPDQRTAGEPRKTSRDDDNDWTRVPTATQTADAITRAQRALNEIQQREAEDRRRDADQARTRQLNHWHHDDRQAEHAAQRNTDRQLDRF